MTDNNSNTIKFDFGYRIKYVDKNYKKKIN